MYMQQVMQPQLVVQLVTVEQVVMVVRLQLVQQARQEEVLLRHLQQDLHMLED